MAFHTKRSITKRTLFLVVLSHLKNMIQTPTTSQMARVSIKLLLAYSDRLYQCACVANTSTVRLYKSSRMQSIQSGNVHIILTNLGCNNTFHINALARPQKIFILEMVMAYFFFNTFYMLFGEGGFYIRPYMHNYINYTVI